MDLTEFVFPCYFIGDPDVLPPTQARNLLGLTGVINQICLTSDGRSSVGSPFGVLEVEACLQPVGRLDRAPKAGLEPPPGRGDRILGPARLPTQSRWRAEDIRIVTLVPKSVGPR